MKILVECVTVNNDFHRNKFYLEVALSKYCQNLQADERERGGFFCEAVIL